MIIKIKRVDALPFLKKHHYLGGVATSAMIYAHFEQNIIDAVIAFNAPCSENVRKSILGTDYKNNTIELSRLAIAPTCKLKASQLVSRAIDILIKERKERGMSPIYCILSFADSRERHHGGVYQAMSWLYCGESIGSATYRYRDANKNVRHTRQCGVNISPKEARLRGWSVERISPLPKHRYIKLCGSKTDKKRSRHLLKFDVLPYPKDQ